MPGRPNSRGRLSLNLLTDPNEAPKIWGNKFPGKNRQRVLPPEKKKIKKKEKKKEKRHKSESDSRTRRVGVLVGCIIAGSKVCGGRFDEESQG
jgi:hypothetical protein